MRKHLFTLFCALCALLLIPNVGKANTVTVPNDPLVTLTPTSYLPTALNSGTSTTSTGTFSVSQQLYFASELSEASSRTIIAITFYCNDAHSSESPDYVRRKLRVWMNHTSITAFPDYATNPAPNFENPGTKVFSSKKGGTDNGVEVTDLAPYTLTFDTPFEWDGTSNILVTVFDSTGVKSGYKTTHHMIQTTGVPRFLHQRTAESSYANAGWSMSNLTAATAVSQNDRGYVNKITFTFAAPAAVVPSVPEDLAATPSANSASLSWSAVEGATSYDLQQSADGETWTELASGETGTSFNWTGLSAASTQYARIRANGAGGSSDWSDPVTVTTEVATDAITYKDITFNKYEETNSLPTSGGNYYLANNITLSSNKTITGDLKLCLNGHTIYTVTNRIIVYGGATLTLYNNESEGLIYGGVETSIAEGGVIDVEVDGTLIIPEGRIENIADASYGSYAVLSSGTLKISGSPELIGESASIYLYGSGKVITIEEGKPLTNTTPYAVNSTGQTITSGWANMDGANPCRYFTSVKSNYSAVVVESNEVKFVQANLKLVDSSDNDTKISDNQGNVSVLAMTRSLTSAQYNTICLPFALSSAQLEDFFGAGYDLEEFVSSSLEDDVLSLTFAPRYSLTAGKPYLLKPDWDIINPTFENVTISVEYPVDNTSDANISFHGTFSPTELTGGDKNTLFLGSGNELFYPSTTANIKAFRAYFEVKGDAPKAAKRARIVKKEDAATGVDQITNDKSPMTNKIIKDGQLLILRDGKTYNVLGIECK